MNVLLKYLTAIVIITIALSNSTDPPNGRTGAPGDGVCSACHQGNNFEGNIQIDGLPEEVISGQSYALSVSVNNTDGNAIRAGFQMVSLFNGDFVNAGEYITNANDSGISVAGGRRYIEHRGAKNFQDNVAEWIFNWEAPLVDEEKEIIMFAAGNIANGSGSSGDAIKFKEAQTRVKPAGADSLKVIIEIIDIVCNGEPGDLTAVATGGEAEYSYLWSNGVTTAENLGVLAGFYSVTVTDANDSMAVAEVVLDEPLNFVFDLQISDESGVGAMDGSIVTEVTGGTAPYTFLWSNGETTKDLSSLSAGEYLLVVTDANSCMDTIGATVGLISCNYDINLSFNQITCAGKEDGEALIDPVGFEQPLSFEWSNGDNAFIAIAGLAAGEYAITVTDGSGCTVVESFTIVDPDPISLETAIQIGDCENPSQNSITTSVEGGTGTYTYLWSNGDNTSSIINAPEGIYSVTVTDANNCEAVSEDILVTFEDDEAPLVTFNDSVSLFVDAEGVIDFAPLNLMESDNCGIQSTMLMGDISCEDLGPRTLTYEVTDMNGNVTSVDIFIPMIIDTVPPSALCVDDIFQDGCDTIFYDLPTFMDNCSIDSIELAEGLPSGSVFPKDSTLITYNVYDKAGNFACCSFWVVTTNDIDLSIDEVTDATTSEGGSINISVTGGSGNFTYEWIFNDTLTVSSFEDVTNLEPGAYRVKVTDDSGCIVLSEVILIEMGSGAIDFALPAVEIFPNPAIDHITIRHDDQLIGLQILSIQGQRLQTKKFTKGTNNSSIDVSELTSGIYFMNLNFVEGTKSIKFTKL